VGMVTVAAEQQVGALKTFEEFPFFARLTNAVFAYGFYLYKAALPFNLSVHYPHPGVWPLGTVVLAATALALITYLALKNFRSRPYLLVGWCWYLISLLPVSGLIQIGSHAYADRYTYIPLIGVFIAVVWGVGEWAAEKGRARTAEQTGGYPRRGDDTGGGDTGEDDTGGDDVKGAPGDVTVKDGSKGGAQEKTAGARPGDDDPAASPLAAWETAGIGQCVAASVKPGDPEVSPAAVAVLGLAVIVALALISVRQVDYWQNAETLFRRAVAVTESNWLAYNNLGAALSRQGRHGEAVPQFETALRSRPDYTEALFNLGAALAGQGRYADALPYYRRVLAQQPRFAEVHNNIAIAYARTGNINQAIAHFREAIRIRPDYGEAIKNLKIAEKEQQRKAAK